MQTKFSILLILCLTLILSAHSQPSQIKPAPGSTVGRSPQEIRLVFAEPTSTNVTIELLPQDSFTPIPGITAQQDSQNSAQVFAKLPPLEPGNYTVQWQVESSDGHFVSGFYDFAVASSIWGGHPSLGHCASPSASLSSSYSTYPNADLCVAVNVNLHQSNLVFLAGGTAVIPHSTHIQSPATHSQQ